jgi:hypothetical protein
MATAVTLDDIRGKDVGFPSKKAHNENYDDKLTSITAASDPAVSNGARAHNVPLCSIFK